MSLLQGRDLSRSPWFDGLDLDLEQGEIVFLHGPTGSGKTLLLRALADLDPFDRGTVSLAGQPSQAHEPWEWRSRVLYVHQGAPRLAGTVQESLEAVFSLASQGGKSAPSPAPLDPTARVDRLSGGEAQGLALHRALWTSPSVLLLDEATSALDPSASTAIETELKAWVTDSDHPRAVLWVSHDEALARRAGTRRVAFP